MFEHNIPYQHILQTLLLYKFGYNDSMTYIEKLIQSQTSLKHVPVNNKLSTSFI